MAATDRERWDLRYAKKSGPDEPSAFLLDIFHSPAWTIRPGTALDIASGQGRNALFLAEQGFDVEAIEISSVALTKARSKAEKQKLRVLWRAADLEQIHLSEAFYDLILNFNYLQRSLTPQIKKAVKVGGHVIFETYLIDQQTVGHPSNPAYLLGHNELLEMFGDFRVLCYREGRFSEGGEAAFRAGLFAQKIS